MKRRFRRHFDPAGASVEAGIPDAELFAEVADPQYRVRVGGERYTGMSYTKARRCAEDGITAYLLELYESGCRDFYTGWERFTRELVISIDPEIERFDPREYAMAKWRWMLGDQAVRKPWDEHRRDWMDALIERGAG